MKIFSLYIEDNIFEISVYESLDDFTKRTEWQDNIDDYYTILDENGNIYKWDESKTDEFATTYNFTLIVKSTNTELGNLCKLNYALNNFASEFTFKI